MIDAYVCEVYQRPCAAIVAHRRTRGRDFPMQRAANVHELVERESDLAPDAAAVLSVSVVGRLTLRFKGRLIELRTQKAGAVLSYLALSETKQESRERLRGLLLRRSGEEPGRGAVSQGR